MPFIFNLNVQGMKKATDNINCHLRDIKIKKMKTATSPVTSPNLFTKRRKICLEHHSDDTSEVLRTLHRRHIISTYRIQRYFPYIVLVKRVLKAWEVYYFKEKN